MDFLINVSQEIKTPVSTICESSGRILQEELPYGVREDALRIRTAGEGLLFRVSDVMVFSELESGRIAVVEKLYHINSCHSHGCRLQGRQGPGADRGLRRGDSAYPVRR